MTKRFTHKVTLYLPEETYQTLQNIAEQKQLKLPTIIRQILIEHIRESAGIAKSGIA